MLDDSSLDRFACGRRCGSLFSEKARHRSVERRKAKMISGGWLERFARMSSGDPDPVRTGVPSLSFGFLRPCFLTISATWHGLRKRCCSVGRGFAIHKHAGRVVYVNEECVGVVAGRRNSAVLYLYTMSSGASMDITGVVFFVVLLGGCCSSWA